MHHDFSQLPRSLSVVDDSKIRNELFSKSSLLLAKIRKLERDLAEFLGWDQILYQEWYHLTFRKELQAAEQLEKRHRVLSTFQVHLKHIATTADVSLEQAYTMLKAEEQQYQSGDESWKFIIERLRQNRFESATKTRQDSPPVNGSAEAPTSEPRVNFADIFSNSDSSLSSLKRHARSVYHYLNSIDDGKMARHMSVPSAGYQLFKESFQIAMTCGDWKLLGRIWRMANAAYQERFFKNMPTHLKEFLIQVISENAEEEVLERKQNETEIQLRSTYRKLARLLHPDTQNEDTSLAHRQWSADKWQRVQEAYKTRNQGSLENIELLCKIELGRHTDLTTDEIRQSSLVLEQELTSLNKNLRTYRKHPAWKFSSRRRYDSLVKKVSSELELKLAPLEEEIMAMENMLNRLSNAEALPN